MVPVYIVLRQQSGAIGLAVPSSASILAYVLLLGRLQRRRFEREAAARGGTLEGTPGMLGAALRMATAAAIAIALGLPARALLTSWLPDMQFTAILLRAAILSSFGCGIYAAAVHLFGVRELSEIANLLLRRLRLRK
jgi:putative peptidoglycan lipid II flippase